MDSADKMKDSFFFWFGEICLEIYSGDAFMSLVPLYSARNKNIQNR